MSLTTSNFDLDQTGFFYLAKSSQGLSIIKVNRMEIDFLTYFLHILSFTCGLFIEMSLIDVLEV